jgi:hypothetical protein
MFAAAPLIRLPGLAHMPPVSREAGSGQGSQVPHKNPTGPGPVDVPHKNPTDKTALCGIHLTDYQQ